jgi:hypothetical protein
METLLGFVKMLLGWLSARWKPMIILALISGAGLRIPVSLQQSAGVFSFTQTYRPYLWFVFLFCTSYLSLASIEWVSKKILAPIWQRHFLKMTLENVPPDQMEVLLLYALSGKSCLSIPLNKMGEFKSLVNKGILYMSSPVGHKLNEAAYSLTPDVEKFFRYGAWQKILKKNGKKRK